MIRYRHDCTIILTAVLKFTTFLDLLILALCSSMIIILLTLILLIILLIRSEISRVCSRYTYMTVKVCVADDV